MGVARSFSQLSVFLTPHKMGRSLTLAGLCLTPLLLSVLLPPGVSGTAPLVIGTATVLTANQIGALIAVGLAIKVVALKAALIGGALAGRRRGRRQLSPHLLRSTTSKLWWSWRRRIATRESSVLLQLRSWTTLTSVTCSSC